MGYLVQLGRYQFLDTALDYSSSKIDPAAAVHLVPAHMFWKVTCTTRETDGQPGRVLIG